MEPFKQASATVWSCLHPTEHIGSLACTVSGWQPDANESAAAKVFFSRSHKKYTELHDRTFHVDVQRDDAVRLLSRLAPEVVICMGGPIYPKRFIEACPLVVNFHSGLSPLYNGSGSIRFAFANGHPHLCGGTLMIMNADVDGGEILGHYLPEICATDTPAALFLRTVCGAAPMLQKFLTHLEHNGRPLVAVAQAPPLFYTRGADWTIYHTRMIRMHLVRQLASQYQRPARIIDYWSEPNKEAADLLFKNTIFQLLCFTRPE